MLNSLLNCTNFSQDGIRTLELPTDRSQSIKCDMNCAGVASKLETYPSETDAQVILERNQSSEPNQKLYNQIMISNVDWFSVFLNFIFEYCGGVTGFGVNSTYSEASSPVSRGCVVSDSHGVSPRDNLPSRLTDSENFPQRQSLAADCRQEVARARKSV